MLQIRTILHPTDFSDISNKAFQFAMGLARDYQAILYVLHVSTPAEAIKGEQFSEERPAQYLAGEWEKLENMKGEGIEIRRCLEEGAPAERILHLAQSLPADVLVVGTHGRSGWKRLAMGSVAEKLIREAPCPVLAIKGT